MSVVFKNIQCFVCLFFIWSTPCNIPWLILDLHSWILLVVHKGPYWMPRIKLRPCKKSSNPLYNLSYPLFSIPIGCIYIFFFQDLFYLLVYQKVSSLFHSWWCSLTQTINVIVLKDKRMLIKGLKGTFQTLPRYKEKWIKRILMTENSGNYIFTSNSWAYFLDHRLYHQPCRHQPAKWFLWCL